MVPPWRNKPKLFSGAAVAARIASDGSDGSGAKVQVAAAKEKAPAAMDPSTAGGAARSVTLLSRQERSQALEGRMKRAAAACEERRALLADMERFAKELGPGGAFGLVSEPWDWKRGKQFDVLQESNAARLRRRAAVTRIQHWAPDCSTFSRALEKAIEGVAANKGPRALRSRAHPEGFPWKQLVEEFGHSADVIHAKLAKHTAMAVLAAEECLKAARSGRYFVIENPARSHIWSLPVFVELAKELSVEFTVLHNCAFGGQRRKYSSHCSALRLGW